MRPIDRVNAFQAIINAIEDSMDLQDVDLFFMSMHISLFDTEAHEAGYYKTDHIRNYLNSCSDKAILNIANQLDLGLTIEDNNQDRFDESTYWKANHFRIFISHIHKRKASAAKLKNSLERYGITSFVAHQDINVSSEWRTEIIKALMSMDALIAIVSEEFNYSNWTDQEVGAAIARDIIIIPIDDGLKPYGFLEQIQNFPSKGKRIGEVADLVFDTIISNPKTKIQLAESLVKLVSISNETEEAIKKIEALAKIPELLNAHWLKAKENISLNNQLMSDEHFLDTFNNYLTSKNIEPLRFKEERSYTEIDDEIPF